MLDRQKHIRALKQAFHMIDVGAHFMLSLLYVVLLLALIALLFACFMIGQLLAAFVVFIIIWVLIRISNSMKDNHE